MHNDIRTVDGDGHVIEPRDTWLDYIAPTYRERAIRIARDDAGDEVVASIRHHLSVLPLADQAKVLGRNALRF